MGTYLLTEPAAAGVAVMPAGVVAAAAAEIALFLDPAVPEGQSASVEAAGAWQAMAPPGGMEVMPGVTEPSPALRQSPPKLEDFKGQARAAWAVTLPLAEPAPAAAAAADSTGSRIWR
jgi:hypothetical protein